MAYRSNRRSNNPMGRLPNYKWSVEKNRELTPIESGLDSIKRKLSRRSRRDKGLERSASSESPYRMSSNGKGQTTISESQDGSDSETVSNEKLGAKNQPYKSNSHGKRVGNGERRLGVSSTNSHLGEKLDPFPAAIDDTVRHLSETSKVIETLKVECKKHAHDIEEAVRNRERVEELEKEVRDQTTTIQTLQRMQSNTEEEFKKGMKGVEKDRVALDQDKDKFEKEKEKEAKKVKAQMAERKAKDDEELEKRKQELQKHFEKLTRDLGQKTEKLEADISKKTLDFDAAKKTLSEKLATQQKKIEKQDQELEKAKETIEDLETLKASLKKDFQNAKKDFTKLKDELALSHGTEESYQENFSDISKKIEDICHRSLKELDPKDFQTIHQKLKCNDHCFDSVPISNSEASRRLRIAHAQRVISSNLQQIIWQQFSSDRTLQQDDVISFLKDSAKALGTSSNPSSSINIPRIFSALAMRGAQYLAPSSQVSTRAERFIENVVKILSPLLPPSDVASFQTDLRALADSAISLWNSAQTDELEVEVCSMLDRANREEWQASAADLLEEDAPESDVTSSILGEVFVLFPRVIVRRRCGAKETESLPGGWPEHDGESRRKETCIHSGIGMTERSACVVRGKEEIKEMEEQAKEEAQAKKDALKQIEEEFAKKRRIN